jgi:hypothetical protein
LTEHKEHLFVTSKEATEELKKFFNVDELKKKESVCKMELKELQKQIETKKFHKFNLKSILLILIKIMK